MGVINNYQQTCHLLQQRRVTHLLGKDKSGRDRTNLVIREEKRKDHERKNRRAKTIGTTKVNGVNQ